MKLGKLLGYMIGLKHICLGTVKLTALWKNFETNKQKLQARYPSNRVGALHDYGIFFPKLLHWLIYR